MKKKKSKIDKMPAPTFDLDNNEFFDLEEKSSHLSSIGVNSVIDPDQCISTGMLCMDLIIGGGILPGKEYEIVGEESGGKTTTIYSILGSAVKTIPNALKAVFIDLEGTIDPKWFKNITKVKNLTDIFGKKNVDGSWEVKPKVRYYKPAFGEQALKFIKRLLKRLPDKVLIGDTWYYMWIPKQPKVIKKTGGYSLADLRKMLAGQFSKRLLSKYGNFYVPVPNNYAGPELLIFIDSWASMTPEAVAEDDSNAMASQARMFGKHLNDIKSLIAAKGVTIVGANQIRHRIGGYGNPEYSPGGNTKKHTVDIRIKLRGTRNQNGDGQVEVVGKDEYKHFHAKVIKSKAFVPYKEMRGRWWFRHDGESGFGSCPVQDLLNYLKMTNQLKMAKRGFVISLKGKNKLFPKLAKVTFNTEKLKQVVLDKKIGKYKIDIRELCFKQIRSGRGITLFLETNAKI